MTNMKSIARWTYIINTLRAIPETDPTKTTLLIDDRRLQMRYNDHYDLVVYDPITNEDLVTFDECGHPITISDWANAPVNWTRYDYPMYEGQA